MADYRSGRRGTHRWVALPRCCNILAEEQECAVLVYAQEMGRSELASQPRLPHRLRFGRLNGSEQGILIG